MSGHHARAAGAVRANSYVGSAVERIEDLRFLRGRGEYADDNHPAGLLHAVILRSAVAHGLIRGIDAAAALALPGVHAVITAADIGATIPTIPMRQEAMEGFRPFEQPVIAHGKVRYVGEPVAVVVAATAARAEDAAETVLLHIDELPPVADRDAAERGDVLLFATPSNRAGTLTAVKGDADAAFREATYVRREAFSVQRHSALPMEPRGLLAHWQDGLLTVSGAAKVAFPNRKILAKQLGLAETAIRMIENDVGGGFGVRGEFYPEDFLIPFAARYVGAPVKWIEDRREHFLATNHARDVACKLEIACTADGTILGLRGHAKADVGAYLRTNGATGARNTAQILSGPYRVPNIHMAVSLLLTTKTPVGTYRGPGRFEADFFRERLFDMVAGDLGLDPAEFRRRNLLSEAEMPYGLATVVELNMGTATDSGDYRTTFERCLREIGWAEKAALQGTEIEGHYHGLAVGCYFEGGASGPRENARLVLETDGTVSVYVGSSANGQGLETAFAQIAADALEIPIAQIRGVFHGSTNLLHEGFGTYSSRSIVMGGSAIVAAAAKLREAIRAAAARRLGCAAGEVEIADGFVRAVPSSPRIASPSPRLREEGRGEGPPLAPAAVGQTTLAAALHCLPDERVGTAVSHHAAPPPRPSPARGEGEVAEAAAPEPATLPSPSPRLRGEGRGEGPPLAPAAVGQTTLAAASHRRPDERVATAVSHHAAPPPRPSPTRGEGEEERGEGEAGISSHDKFGAVSLAELAEEGIAADGTYASPHRTYSYGAHAAHVAVDPRTGQVEVIDYIAVEDVGRIINPAMLHGQTVGAIVQGLGGTFLEHLIYDAQGQLLTASFADYLMPSASDFPVVRAVALEEKPAPHNPLGAKGAGEGGIIPVGGVIANAIAAALRPLGVEPRALPLSPPRLWEMIAQARSVDI